MTILTMIAWLYVINLFAAGILIGGLIHAWKLVVGGLRELPQVTQVRVHQGMLYLTPDRFMQPSCLTSAASALAILFFRYQADLLLGPPLVIASTALMILGLLGDVGVVIASRFFGVRINAIIATWSLDAIPPEYPAMRRKWDKTHFIRMMCGGLAFLSFLLSFVTLTLAQQTWDWANLLLILLLFVNAVLLAVTAGTRVMTAFNIIPEKDLMPTTMAMQAHHAMFDMKKDAFMKPTGILSALTVVAILIVLGVSRKLTVELGVFYGIALAGTLVIIVIANRFLIPFHTKVQTWSAESPPAEYGQAMRTFRNMMYCHLVASIVAWMCVLIAGIIILMPVS